MLQLISFRRRKLFIHFASQCEDSDVDGIMDTGENMLSWKSAARDLEFGNDVERLNSNRCDSSPRNALPNIELNDNFHSTLIDCEGKMIPEGALFNRLVF